MSTPLCIGEQTCNGVHFVLVLLGHHIVQVWGAESVSNMLDMLPSIKQLPINNTITSTFILNIQCFKNW